MILIPSEDLDNLSPKDVSFLVLSEVYYECRRLLSEYMCPQYLKEVNAFLYTASGKLDRRIMLRMCLHNKTNIGGIKDEKETLGRLIKVLEGIIGNYISDIVVNNDTKLVDLMLYSLNFIEFIVDLETEFEIEFEDSKLQMDEFNIVGELVDYIEEATRNQGNNRYAIRS